MIKSYGFTANVRPYSQELNSVTANPPTSGSFPYRSGGLETSVSDFLQNKLTKRRLPVTDPAKPLRSIEINNPTPHFIKVFSESNDSLERTVGVSQLSNFYRSRRAELAICKPYSRMCTSVYGDSTTLFCAEFVGVSQHPSDSDAVSSEYAPQDYSVTLYSGSDRCEPYEILNAFSHFTNFRFSLSGGASSFILNGFSPLDVSVKRQLELFFQSAVTQTANRMFIYGMKSGLFNLQSVSGNYLPDSNVSDLLLDSRLIPSHYMNEGAELRGLTFDLSGLPYAQYQTFFTSTGIVTGSIREWR